MKKKPTYKTPVSICAIALVVGAIILAILMETRQMAPPRKYEVDMSGEVIGIDNGPKEEIEEKEVKEEKQQEEKPKEVAPKVEEPTEPEQPVIVPDVPEGQAEPSVKAPMPEIKKPTIDKIDY